MIRGAILLGLTLVLAACSGAPWRPVTDWVQAWRLVERADRLGGDGDHKGARALYEQVVEGYPTSPWAPRALFRLAQLEVTPESPVLNYWRAFGHFDRVANDYPESPLAAEARAWREALLQLLTREREAARVRQEIERLRLAEIRVEQEALRVKEDMERVKRSEIRMEQEALRVKPELERLKRNEIRLEQEALRVKQELERLKQNEIRQQQEALQVRQDLERLKQTDVELETKRP